MLRSLASWSLCCLAIAAPTAATQTVLPAISVRGVVLDPAGKPIEAATVNLLSAPDEQPETRIPAVLASGRTLADGSFAIELVQSPESLRVHVAKAPYAPSLVVAVQPTAMVVELGAIGLAPPRALRGRAVGAAGAPLAGATVYARSAIDVGPFDPALRSATTDAQGQFRFDALPLAPLTIGGLAAGHAPAWREGLDLRAPELDDVLLEFAPAAPLRPVVVVDADDRPLPGATLRWISSAGAVPFFLTGELGRSTASADGTILWPESLPERIQLECAAPGHVPRTFTEPPRDGRVALAHGREAWVRLLDVRGEQVPLREVRIEGYVKVGDAWERTETRVDSGLARPTDASAWKILLPFADDVRVSVQATDGERCPPKSVDPRQLGPSKGRDEPLRIDVERGAAFDIVGNVRNASGEPLAGERIELQRASPVAGQRQPFCAVTSDDAGHFRFANVPAGAYVAQGIAQAAASAPVEAPLDRAAELGPLTLTMERWHRATVTLTESNAPPALPRLIDVRRYEGNPREGAFVVLETARTNSNGIATFDTLPPGELLVIPHAPADPATWTYRSVAAELPRPDFKYGWPHRLRTGDSPGASIATEAVPATWIRVRVRENDHPTAGAHVEAVLGRDIPAAATTGPEGDVHLRVRARGELTLRVTRGALRAETKVTVDPGHDQTVTLALGVGAVSGRVVGKDGRGLPRLRLVVERRLADGAFGDATGLVSDANGGFELASIAVGDYRVVTADPERRFATIASPTFTVEAGGRATLPDLVVPNAATLSVHLAATGVDRPPFASITVRGPGLARPVEAWCAEGKGEVLGLPPGPVTVTVQVHGAFTQPAAVTTEVPEGGAASVTVETAKS